MTTSRYPSGCSTRSQACGDAALAGSPAYAWIVNFNNGNSNNNHRDNNAFVRAVRSVPSSSLPGEYQGTPQRPVPLRSLYDAWKRARLAKTPSRNQLAFDAHWSTNLLHLQDQIKAGTWSPRPTTCFIATRPKAREIHAPDFSDRVVHHWLVPQLEVVFEPGFIHDSYANRIGKGSHAAVRRLEQFVREVHSGQNGGWYLQLDISNFFNRIDRPTLYATLKRRMQRAGLPLVVQQMTHALLRSAPLAAGVNTRATAAELAQVPAHKRLANAPKGRGIPIGNLSSQFFANVYLDALDQFTKHTLKAKRYLRYVDDFVLVHHDREQLASWLPAIERFLRDTLKLELKPDIRLRPLTDGIDFLGYVVYPTHTAVRRRVVTHAREALADWQREHIRGTEAHVRPQDVRAARAIWASYLGHFAHASTVHLVRDFHRRFPWLRTIAERPRRFDHRTEGRRMRLPIMPRRPL